MKKIIRDKTVEVWKFLSVYSSFHKYHKTVSNNSDFKRIKLTNDEKKEYRDYWKVISPIINFKAVEISKSLSGVFDKRIIPEEFFPLYIEPHLNSERSISFLENKSVYNKWFGEGVFPKDFFHKFNDKYYTYDFEIIENIENFIDDTISPVDFPMVIKPNKDSYGGKDIYFVNSKKEIKKIISQHSNLVVQEKIEQSNLINVFNKDSINTIRICLYKDDKDVIHVLNTSIRMGIDGSLDNVSAGGIICTVKSDGTLKKYAFDKNVNKYPIHPNSSLVFKGKKLPLYDELIEASKSIFSNITEAQLVSLDMCLDSTEKWRCIEINLFGQTIRFMQYAGEPFLGEYTDEIINSI